MDSLISNSDLINDQLARYGVKSATIPKHYDHVVEEGNTNKVVHRIKKLFEHT